MWFREKVAHFKVDRKNHLDSFENWVYDGFNAFRPLYWYSKSSVESILQVFYIGVRILDTRFSRKHENFLPTRHMFIILRVNSIIIIFLKWCEMCHFSENWLLDEFSRHTVRACYVIYCILAVSVRKLPILHDKKKPLRENVSYMCSFCVKPRIILCSV